MRRKVNNSEIHETKRYYEVPSEKVQEWSDTIENLTKQCYQYKTERDTLIGDLSWYKAKVSRLEREKEKLKESHIKHITNMENYYKDRVQELKEENKALRLQSDTYFEQWQNEKLTSKGLREQCKEYAQDASKFLNILFEISKHIGRKPASSKYKYFRAKLDCLGIKEGE